MVSRRAWRVFRQHFDELCLKPLLDYTLYCGITEEGEAYRFMGGFESTDAQTLWIRSETLTIPVILSNAHTYIISIPEGRALFESFYSAEEAPERIRWDRVASLTKGAKVFVGGNLVKQQDRWVFAATNKKNPLLVIFYDGSARSIPMRTIRAGRNKNEYWNSVTPYSFIAGACCQLAIAGSFLARPAFRLTAITAFIALFTPFFPLFPPGVLFTVFYRRLWWRARILRVYRDVLRLPLKYLSPGTWHCRLPNGESYGGIYYDALPQEFDEKQIPVLIPEKAGENKRGRKGAGWYVFGALPEAPSGDPQPLPQKPQDLFATFGAIPGNPDRLAQSYTIKTYVLEISSFFFLFAGIGINLFFIALIISVLL